MEAKKIAEKQTVRKKRSTKPPKKWTWSKPKDKPKRPLSAYNIFFCHSRSRIINGLPDEGEYTEVVASIKHILATCAKKKQKRVRTKSHGKVEFGNLGKRVSEMWKNTKEERKALFQHYAELDKKRYYSEVALWKRSKESGPVCEPSGCNGFSKSSATTDSTLSGDEYELFLNDSSRRTLNIIGWKENWLNVEPVRLDELQHMSAENQRIRQEIKKLAAMLTACNPEGIIKTNSIMNVHQEAGLLTKEELFCSSEGKMNTDDNGILIQQEPEHQTISSFDESIYDKNCGPGELAANSLFGSQKYSLPPPPPHELQKVISSSSHDTMDEHDEIKSLDDSLDPVPLGEIYDSAKYFL